MVPPPKKNPGYATPSACILINNLFIFFSNYLSKIRFANYNGGYKFKILNRNIFSHFHYTLQKNSMYNGGYCDPPVATIMATDSYLVAGRWFNLLEESILSFFPENMIILK